MLSTLNRLQLATRIHIALLCKLGAGVDVLRMLRRRDYAEQALELCRCTGSYTLSELADDFDDAMAAEDAKAHLAMAAESTRAALAQIAVSGERPAPTPGSVWASLSRHHAASN